MNLNFTYCPVWFDLCESRRVEILSEIESLGGEYWYLDDFRGTEILPVKTVAGRFLRKDVAASVGELAFTPFMRSAPEFCELIKEFESIFGLNGRIFVLKTRKGMSLKPHIDCKRTEVFDFHLKFRCVLNGEIDGLYFLDGKLGARRVPNQFRTYIIDGGHPHGLIKCKDDKITLCIGSPWDFSTLNYDHLRWEEMLKLDRPEILDTYCDLVRLEGGQKGGP